MELEKIQYSKVHLQSLRITWKECITVSHPLIQSPSGNLRLHFTSHKYTLLAMAGQQWESVEFQYNQYWWHHTLQIWWLMPWFTYFSCHYILQLQLAQSQSFPSVKPNTGLTLTKTRYCLWQTRNYIIMTAVSTNYRYWRQITSYHPNMVTSEVYLI